MSMPLDPSPATARFARLEAMLRRIHSEEPAAEPPSDRQFLLFVSGGILCAAPLITFREVLSELPRHTMLPFSPPWMLGICAFRNELMGLVDPAPMLLGTPDAAPTLALDGPFLAGSDIPTATGIPPTRPHVLVVGEGSRSLALAVQAVLDIVTVEDDAIRELDAPGNPTLRCAPAYAAGFVLPPNGDGSYTLVRMDALLSDLLTALEGANAEAGAHE